MNFGRKILSGSFNLTTISLPIKAMVPKSHLENIALGSTIRLFYFDFDSFIACYFPLYFNLASKSQDPVQRMKYSVIGSIAYYYLTNSFAKPVIHFNFINHHVSDLIVKSYFGRNYAWAL